MVRVRPVYGLARTCSMKNRNCLVSIFKSGSGKIPDRAKSGTKPPHKTKSPRAALAINLRSSGAPDETILCRSRAELQGWLQPG
jgi:hypothetical protein